MMGKSEVEMRPMLLQPFCCALPGCRYKEECGLRAGTRAPMLRADVCATNGLRVWCETIVCGHFSGSEGRHGQAS